MGSSYKTSLEDMRPRIVTRFYGDKIDMSKELVFNQQQLMSGLGDVVARAIDPISALREEHLKNMLRIVDLYKVKKDPYLVASQFAELRIALTKTTFRFVSANENGDYALVLGGSAIKRDHTLLTDVDTIIVPFNAKNRENALRVQRKMFNTLEDIGILTDDAMPINFDGRPFGEIQKILRPFAPENLNDAITRSLYLGNSAFYRFVSDLSVIDASGTRKTSDYSSQLTDMQNDVFFGIPNSMIKLSWVSLQSRISGVSKNHKDGVLFNMKNEALRPFSYALYATRARYNIGDPSPMNTLGYLSDIGMITGPEKAKAISDFGFFLNIRHLMGFGVYNAVDSIKISNPTINVAAKYYHMPSIDLIRKIEISAKYMRDIAVRIFKRMGTDKNGDTGKKESSTGR